MKRIGIIGGMSYQSTANYYEEINRRVNDLAGGLNSADLVIKSVNFAVFHELMDAGHWTEIAHRLDHMALDLVVLDGCDYVAIATNTMHKVASIVAGAHTIKDNIWPPTETVVNVELIHIGDSIAKKCKEVDAKRILLLGTKFTMTESFLKDYLKEMHEIETIDLSGYPEEIDEINRIIFEELCRGDITNKSADYLWDFISRFLDDADEEPDAIVLGCTELDMLFRDQAIRGADDLIPVIDSTEAHIESIVECCLSD
jgi:aspartate racemase